MAESTQNTADTGNTDGAVTTPAPKKSFKKKGTKMAESTQNTADTGNTDGAVTTPAPKKEAPVKLKRGSSDEDIKKAYAAGGVSYYQISQTVFESNSDENVAKVRVIIEGSTSEAE